MVSLQSLFNIKRDEERSALLMLVHAFFMGTATVFFETSSSALFLSRYKAEMLPYIYIGAAVLSTLTGALYTRLRERVSFWTLMLATIGFLLVSVVAFRIGLMFAVSAAAWLVFALFIWYRLISILTDLEFWAVAARLYDVRQSKRLYGFIGSGEVVARVTGSFSVPLIVATVGAANLLWVSATGLLVCFVVLAAVRRAPKASVDEPVARSAAAAEAKALSRFSRLIRNRYVRVIFMVTMLGVLGKYFVDFAFLQQMQVRYHDVNRLAAFFGIFSGTTQVINLLMRALLSGRLLNRYGIRIGLLTLPAAHLICTLLIIIVGTLMGHGPMVFWLVVVNQGLNKTLKHWIDNPATKVLYQPLRSDVRFAVQIANEVIVNPITLGAAGCIMLLFNKFLHYDPVTFSWLLLVTFLCWIAAAAVAVREYAIALNDALRRHSVEGGAFSIADGPSIAVVQNRLHSAWPGDVIYSLSLLERIEHVSLVSSLNDLLNHPSAEVREYVLLTMARLRIAAAVPAAKGRVTSESEAPRVRAAALALVGDVDEASASFVAAYADWPVPAVRMASLISLLRSGDPHTREIGTTKINALLASSDPPERLVALRAIAKSGRDDLAPEVMRLLNDPHGEVPRVALKTLGKLKRADAAAVARLSDPRLCATASSVVVKGGVASIPLLADAWKNTADRRVRTRIARACGRIGGQAAQSFLRSQIEVSDHALRSSVLEALAGTKFSAPQSDRELMQRMIERDVATAAHAYAASRDLPFTRSFDLLRAAIDREILLARRRIYALLSFLYDRSMIQRSQENITNPSREKRAYALEIIDVTVSEPLKSAVMPLLDDTPVADRLLKLSGRFPQPARSAAGWVEKIIIGEDGVFSEWTRSVAIWVAGVAKLPGTGDLLRALSTSEASLLRETAQAVLRKSLRPPYTSRAGTMDTTIEKVIILKSVSILAETTEDILAEVASVLEEVDLPAGARVFEKGDVGDSLYIVVNGRVRVHDGDRTITYLADRDIFGELAVLDPEPRSASVTTTEETKLFRLDRETFYDLMPEHIEIVRGIFHVLCQRFRALTATRGLAPAPAEEAVSR